MKYLLVSILMFSLVVTNALAQKAMSSDGYKIQSDSANFGGRMSSSSNYSIQDTFGEAASGQTDSTTYRDYLGYQFMLFADPDTTLPIAPSSITAQVISTSEVELTWSESTDNIAVERYYIYRDGVRIDDVAIFPRDFNDTGLSSDTQYSYNISAVDDSGNESLWSATTTATTFASSVSGSSQSGRSSIVSNFSISANDDNAVVSFVTYQPRSVQIDWGRDSNYLDGSVSSELSTDHDLVLTNLVSSSDYYLRITLRDQFGNPVVYENIPFRTLAVAISKIPPNVSSFISNQKENSIELSWKMPLDNRVVGVTIVRSEKAYPTSPNDGTVVLNSTGFVNSEYYSDSSVKKGIVYYYTIFTRDLADNFSSGVVTANKIALLEGEVFENPLEKFLPAGNVDPMIERLSLKDFLFIQSGDSVDVPNSRVVVSGDKNLTVALKYYRVPPVLKTIAVSLIKKDGNKERFTFILRPNKDKTRYEAVIGPLGDVREYQLKIDILDFKNQGLKTLEGVLDVSQSKVVPTKLPVDINKYAGMAGGSLLVLIVLGLVVVRFKRGSMPLVNTGSPITN